MKHLEKKYKDFMVSGEEFSLEIVKKYPGLLKTTPTPQLESLSSYYDSNAYLSHQNQVDSIFSWLYFRVKQYNLRKKYKLIIKNHTDPKVLDYGCGVGDLVQYLNYKQINSFGFEPNANAYNIASSKNPSKIFNNTAFLEKEKFDVITLWHVLEHIPDLENVLAKLKHSLKPNGKLIIAVPNYESYDAQYYQEYWAAYDVPRHLWHFNQTSMHQITKEFGMIIESTYPMFFDAFYVSMLSEKYKGNKLGLVRAFYIALISNLKAMQTNQYSSIIYQIKQQ